MSILDEINEAFKRASEPQQERIMISGTEWRAFLAACHEAGVAVPTSANYWNWRITGKVIEDPQRA